MVLPMIAAQRIVLRESRRAKRGGRPRNIQSSCMLAEVLDAQ